MTSLDSAVIDWLGRNLSRVKREKLGLRDYPVALGEGVVYPDDKLPCCDKGHGGYSLMASWYLTRLRQKTLRHVATLHEVKVGELKGAVKTRQSEGK